jgi:hypothetical protein
MRWLPENSQSITLTGVVNSKGLMKSHRPKSLKAAARQVAGEVETERQSNEKMILLSVRCIVFMIIIDN